MKCRRILLSPAMIFLMVAASPVIGSQVLVRIGDNTINEDDLAMAMASAPFATQFPGMDEDTQAGLRGNMLLRLVNAELLRQESIAKHLDSSEQYIHEVNEYRDSLLYQNYIRQLRESVVIPDAINAEMKQRYLGNPDALAAARSIYISRQYRQLSQRRFEELRNKYQLQINEQGFENTPGDDDVIASTSFFKIVYGDIKSERSEAGMRQVTLEREHLNDMIDVAIAAHAATESGMDVSEDVAKFGRELLPQLLLTSREQEWIPDESVLRDYYQTHPQLSRIPERQHVAQIVLADCDQASRMRERIEAGESLFSLASEFSIDPEGRKSAGDLGWLVKGSGNPALESAIADLAPGDLSEPVSTPMGCHVLQLIELKPGRQRAYAEISDAVRQALLVDRLNDYMKTLAEKYPVSWLLPVQKEALSGNSD